MTPRAAQRHFPGELEALDLRSFGVPRHHGAIATAGDELAVVRVGDAERAASVGVPCFGLLAFTALPELGGAILAAGGEQAGIAPPTQARHRAFVANGGKKLLRIVGVPDSDATVAVGGGEHFAIGAEGERDHPVGVLLDLVFQFAGLGGVNLHEAIRAANRDARLVRTHVRREHGVVFIADGGDALAALDIPEHHPARLGTVTTGGEQELARPGELHLRRLAFGEGENANQVEVGRVVEEHLLLPRHGEQRRPGTGGKPVDGVAARGVERRLDGEFPRHRRRALRFAGRGDFQGEINRGPRGGNGLGTRCLEQPARDPFLEHRQFLLWKRRLVRWHVRLLGMRQHLDELAGIGIARHEEHAGATALERCGVSSEIEVAFLLVRVVTLGAMRLNQRQDVIRVGDLLLG